jgi:hypothetical protein
MQPTQSIETVNSIPFVGKTVTVSYYARAGANYSPTGSALAAFLATGTGTDQSVNLPFTGVSYTITGTATLTTTWQRFSFTGTVPTTATQLGLLFNFTPTGTAGANDWFEITGVQIDIGSVALPFRTYAGTIQGELAACQRYYWRQTAADAYAKYATGYVEGTTSRTNFVITPPVPMRVVPSSIDYATLQIIDSSFAGGGTITLTIVESNSFPIAILGTGSTGLTAHRTALLRANNSTSAYLGFSAEL